MIIAGQISNVVKVLDAINVPCFIMLVHAFDGFDLVGGWTMYIKLFDITSTKMPEELAKKAESILTKKEGLKEMYEGILYPEVWKLYMIHI